MRYETSDGHRQLGDRSAGRQYRPDVGRDSGNASTSADAPQSDCATRSKPFSGRYRPWTSATGGFTGGFNPPRCVGLFRVTPEELTELQSAAAHLDREGLAERSGIVRKLSRKLRALSSAPARQGA